MKIIIILFVQFIFFSNSFVAQDANIDTVAIFRYHTIGLDSLDLILFNSGLVLEKEYLNSKDSTLSLYLDDKPISLFEKETTIQIDSFYISKDEIFTIFSEETVFENFRISKPFIKTKDTLNYETIYHKIFFLTAGKMIYDGSYELGFTKYKNRSIQKFTITFDLKPRQIIYSIYLDEVYRLPLHFYFEERITLPGGGSQCINFERYTLQSIKNEF